ncbi:nuclear transport factor 2 family protein [Picrophilus oshimae]|uniref:SnoaL-like domain-containing protein n=1 Tax=Picrophilus torridus (strain ATCC 700027 / DSM 9790 / JCM 10055 / NBRC 100828 / KAW 2/3) TaxID=1122961 RepID=A0A8G2L7Z4_PICTO|nr:nuclear transport factor 2 family protein [Picrophilus oshimae]SMD30825.1 hypothetical protein SAMN02745355_0739 [Picrophilus oshimae DSM 9789]
MDIKQICLDYYNAVDSRDLKTLFSIFDDSIVYKRPGYGEIKGINDFKKFYEEHRIIKSGHHTIKRIIISGSCAVVEGSFSGTLKDGRSVSTEFIDVMDFANDKIVKRHTYFDGENI